MTDAQATRVRSLRAKLLEMTARARGQQTSLSRSGLVKLLEVTEDEELDREVELLARMINARGKANARATLNGLELSMKGESLVVEEDIDRVLEAWKARFSPRSSMADRKRRARVLARLHDGRTVDELLRVLDGVERSDWHMGRDPRTKGAKYIGIKTIYRDDEQIDKFLELAGGPAVVTSETDDAFARATDPERRW